MNLVFLRRDVPLMLLLVALTTTGPVRAQDKDGPGIIASTDASRAPRLPPVKPLTFTNILTGPENGAWNAKPGLWEVAPRGRSNEFAGVRFWLEGLLQLQGKRSLDTEHKFREKIVLPLIAPTNFSTLHLLGGTSLAEAPAETKIADVVWRYTDGTLRRTPLLYGVHLRDWWGRRYEEPATVSDPTSKSVWQGSHPDATKRGSVLRLYLTSLANPDTNKAVKSVEFVSAMAAPSLFLVGVSLDRLPPGARNGDFRDLDEGRPALTGTQFVTVLDAATSKPIPGAKVKIHGREWQDTPDFAEYDREGLTGANGVAVVQKGEQGLERLEIRVEIEDYGGYHHEFNLKKGEVVPANLEVRITGGLKLGGVVKDPDGNPVPNAKVSAYVSWRNDDEQQVISQFTFDRRETTSDTDGKWTIRGVPEPIVQNLNFHASHPDFVAARVSLGRGGAGLRPLEELKKQTYILQLLRGCEVNGVVLDPDNQPVVGATVRAGRRWSPDSNQETTTGPDGRFRLLNLKSELQAITALADGYSAATTAVTPGTNATELVLNLKRSTGLRGVVLNPEGKPVPEARIVYEPSHFDYERNNLEWEGRSDENGRFEWASAPETEVEFYVSKEGYAQKRKAKAKAGEVDNVIRLTRSRTILGVVGDEQSQEALTEFYVLPAEGDAEQLSSWSDSDRKEYSDPRGQFTLTIDDESHNVIKVGAPDHRPKLIVLPPSKDDFISLTILLEAAEDASGIVVDPNGQPVPGVEVALVAAQSFVTLSEGRLRSEGNGRGLTRTDAQGQFKLPLETRPMRMVAASAGGFADVDWVAFQQTKTLVLQPWGRIEATVSVGGQPAEGRMYMLSLLPEGWSEGSLNMDWGTYRVVTDKDGKFTMERVPPGMRGLTRLIQTDARSWSHDNTTAIEVKPGELTEINLGDTGAIITGHVNAELLLSGKEGARLYGHLATPFPQPPSSLKNQADYQAWSELPETKASIRAVKRHTAQFNPDGTFKFESVGPGEYGLSIMATMPKPGGSQWDTLQLGQLSKLVVIPEDAVGGTSPFDLGELTLTATPLPAPTVDDQTKP